VTGDNFAGSRRRHRIFLPGRAAHGPRPCLRRIHGRAAPSPFRDRWVENASTSAARSRSTATSFFASARSSPAWSTSLGMIARINRRETITLLGCAAVAGPLAARAQQGNGVRRIGVLMPFDKTTPCGSLASLRSRKLLRPWVGPMAATCGWTFGGAALTSIGCERSRRSWSACDIESRARSKTGAPGGLVREILAAREQRLAGHKVEAPPAMGSTLRLKPEELGGIMVGAAG